MNAPMKWRGIRPWKRHSLVLAVAGLIYVLIGVAYILSEPTEARAIALQVALAWMPFSYWGGIFVAVGLLSMISARWPPVSETWGYTLMTGLSSGWAMFYLVGVWFKDAPASNLTAVLSWGLIGFLWWAISGLLNPDSSTVTGD